MHAEPLRLGRFYFVPEHGVCECVRVGVGRARLKPMSKSVVTVGGRTFLARGKAFDVSPTSPLRVVPATLARMEG